MAGWEATPVLHLDPSRAKPSPPSQWYAPAEKTSWREENIVQSIRALVVRCRVKHWAAGSVDNRQADAGSYSVVHEAWKQGLPHAAMSVFGTELLHFLAFAFGGIERFVVSVRKSLTLPWFYSSVLFFYFPLSYSLFTHQTFDLPSFASLKKNINSRRRPTLPPRLAGRSLRQFPPPGRRTLAAAWAAVEEDRKKKRMRTWSSR